MQDPRLAVPEIQIPSELFDGFIMYRHAAVEEG